MTKTFIEPYLFFGGRCEEALEFYREAVGAKVGYVMRYNESPQPVPEGMLQPGFENKIMHCTFQVGDTTLMASDGCFEDSGFKGFNLSLVLPNAQEVEKAFDILCAGGQISMPLAPTFWSPLFGMLTDKFGVGWMLSVPEQK